MKLSKMTQLPRQLFWAIVMEGVGATRMVHTYARHGSGKLKLTPVHLHPSPEELEVAWEQLKDIPKSLLFIVVFLVPLPGFVGGYTLVAISIERRFGSRIKLLPNRFRHILNPEKEV